ncbi:DUF3177 family protein [Gloeocapsa sp. PCC 73106]|uniref:DUF3177 family protein n=1 Tax=Gloeocapsa sp. PCC 73106 TaxID=102232 RepID=UPI0002ACFB1B|nr:DUF3177 family protein [Gloeocapsa sp. PCC 73106]ELR99776.1 Protein of unknown function (DUF3177) [Gloeocapsa sp. PCC 73106]
MFDIEKVDLAFLEKIIWTDYRLAVIFTVILPLVLLVWAFVRKTESLTRLLIVYWRVASLLMITVYLLIAALPFSFLTGLFARILIPISLWFWQDLNEEIRDLPKTSLKTAFKSWRWAMTVYCSLGVLLTVPFLSCAFASEIKGISYCRLWLQPPWGYKELMHPNGDPGVLGFFGIMGLAVYVLYLLYFVFVRLGKQGRSALEP